MERLQEQKLIKAAQNGDSDAFTELYRANVDQIYRYLYYRVFSVPVAEDLTSEVFIRALEGLPGYQDRSMPLLSWLYRIAHARLVDHYRNSQRRDNDADLDDLHMRVDDNLDEALMAVHQSSTLEQAMKSLSPDQQQVIIFRFIEGHSLETTAGLMDKSVQAIKSLQYRAVQSLGKALASEGPELYEV